MGKKISKMSNVDLQNIIEKIAIYVHNQCVEVRKEYDIKDGHIRLYSDYAIYPNDNNEYYAFHYVVHVDNKYDRFFIVSWTPATEDEYLDSIEY